MDDQDKKEEEKDDTKIIHFPELEKRDTVAKSLKAAREKREKEEHEAREKSAREQQRRANTYYSADTEKNPHPAMLRARSTLNDAKKSGAKEPFVNWDKVPPFTRVILGLIIVVHIAMAFLIDQSTRLELTYTFSLVPARFTGELPWEAVFFLTPITSLLIHGSWFHLGMNGAMMLITGVFFERQFGAKSTLMVFIACGIAGHLACIGLNPYAQSAIIGASGAINGLFALTFMLMIHQGMMGPVLQAEGPKRFIFLWLAIIVGVGLLSENISWQSHLGGFLCGIGIFYLWKQGKIKL